MNEDAREQPRWLGAQEQRLWRSYLEVTQRMWETLGRELDADGDLPLTEYDVLVRLTEAPDGMLRMSGLATAVVHSRSRLTHTVGRMEARGLVERRACADDRRGVLCVVTPAGRAELERHAPAHVRGVRRHLFDQLDAAETESLGRVLDKLVTHLRPG